MYPAEHVWFGGWWMFPMIMPIVMIVVVLIVLYFVFGRGGHRPQWWNRYPGPESESPMEILKKRYAKGEITKDEFEQMKKDILS